jgi:hypothetical protein
MRSETTNDPRTAAGLAANLDYWKRVADRYRVERDAATQEVQRLQAELLRRTGRAYDGLDYLREIQRSRQGVVFSQRIKNLLRGYL